MIKCFNLLSLIVERLDELFEKQYHAMARSFYRSYLINILENDNVIRKIGKYLYCKKTTIIICIFY